MKNKISFLVIGLLSFIILGCNSNQQTAPVASDSTQSNRDSATDTSARMPSTVSDSDAKFAVDAANAGMTEVELGKIAQENSSNKEITDFGAMMIKDHTAAGDELKKIALSKHITLPTAIAADNQQKISDLSKKKGNAFDRAYIEMMVKGHEKVAAMFENESKNGSDPDLKGFASRTLNVIHTHLDTAKKCQSNLKK
jgi:putative membrane protein